MFASATGPIREPAAMLESSFAGNAPQRSVVATIRRGILIGAIATVLELLLAVALLYASGILAA